MLLAGIILVRMLASPTMSVVCLGTPLSWRLIEKQNLAARQPHTGDELQLIKPEALGLQERMKATIPHLRYSQISCGKASRTPLPRDIYLVLYMPRVAEGRLQNERSNTGIRLWERSADIRRHSDLRSITARVEASRHRRARHGSQELSASQQRSFRDHATSAFAGERRPLPAPKRERQANARLKTDLP